MLVLIIIIFFALLGSAFISASEASIIAVNKVRIKHLSDQGNKKAQAIEKTLNENEKFFGTLLLFGNLLNVLIATLVGALVLNIFGQGSVNGVIVATIISKEPNLKRNMKPRKPRNQMRKPPSKASFKPKSNPKDKVKKQNGNVKKPIKESVDKPIDDNIGNRKEPANKSTKRSVTRAKNDPRSKS